MCNPAAKWQYATDADNNAVVVGGKKKKNKSSSAGGALRRMTIPILFGYLFNTCAYLFLAHGPLLLPSNLASSSRYCPTTTTTTTTITCTRRDLLAFQAVSLLNLSFLGLFGLHSFFVSKDRPCMSLPRTPTGRTLHRSLRMADIINAAIVVFQGWDLVMSTYFEEHREIVMLVHHLLAFTCGYFCLVYEVLPYYAVYFGGVCEFSSIFLCISDFFQVHPPSSIAHPSTSLCWMLEIVEILSQATFVLTFFAFRIVGWAFMLYMFIMDGSYLIRSGLLKTYRPGSGWFLWYEMTLGVLLGALQVYWLKAILEKVSKILE